MSDTTTITPDLLAVLQAQLAATQKPIAAGWGQPTQATPIQGVAVPIKVQTPKGSLRLYLQLGPEVAANPESIMAAIQALDAQGYPLDTWQPQGSGGWGSGNSGGGGWNRGNGGGGWRR